MIVKCGRDGLPEFEQAVSSPARNHGGPYPCEREHRRRLWDRDPLQRRPAATVWDRGVVASPARRAAVACPGQEHQIAADLHLAPETVRNYVGSLLKTLGARSRSRQLSSRFGTASSPWIWTEGPGPAGPWAELLARSDCRTIRPWLASSGSSSGSCKALRTWSGSAPGTTGRSHFSAARSSTCSAVARPGSVAVRDGPERA
jgi:hypothetical protein